MERRTFLKTLGLIISAPAAFLASAKVRPINDIPFYLQDPSLEKKFPGTTWAVKILMDELDEYFGSRVRTYVYEYGEALAVFVTLGEKCYRGYIPYRVRLRLYDYDRRVDFQRTSENEKILSNFIKKCRRFCEM